jgi:signal transduction histidine kinase
VAAAGLLAALALVFTNATGVVAVADNARLQQEAESALGAAASARNALGQALLIAGSSNDPSLAAAAAFEAESVIGAMQQRVETVITDLADFEDLADPAGRATPADLESSLASVLADSAQVLDAVAAGDLVQASSVATGASAASFSLLVDQLAGLRDELAAGIAGAAAESGTIATASRFMVAFFVPSVAVVVAFLISRRRRKREWMTVELEQERALNKSKDQLIANLSHELRTPLTGIYTSALAMSDEGYADLDLTKELTEVIIDQSADLTRMVEDLLVSAQADAGRLRFDLKPTDIAELVASLGHEFDRSEAKVDLRVADGMVLVDPGRLRQLLRNLVSNAAKYGGGRVGISGRLEGLTYFVEVVDDGPGVPPEVETRMFERFVHRGDEPLIMGSVGLGLSISRVLADGMGGKIAYRRAGNLTVFQVALQTAQTEELVLPPDPSPTQAPVVVAEEAPAGHTGIVREARPPGEDPWYPPNELEPQHPEIDAR